MTGLLDRLDGVRATLRRASVALGVAAVLFAVALVAFEGLLPAVVRAPIAAVAETLGQSVVAWTLAVAGIAYVVWRVFRGRRREALAPGLVSDPPETATGDPPLTGNRFEAIVADHAEVADPTAADGRIRSALADVVVDVESRATDRPEDEIRARIRRGDWTDDRIAAAFLGGDPAPGYPLRARLFGWLVPSRAYRRRVERTVDAIHGLTVGRNRDPDRLGGARDDRSPPTIAPEVPGTTPGADDDGHRRERSRVDDGDRSPAKRDRDGEADDEAVLRPEVNR